MPTMLGLFDLLSDTNEGWFALLNERPRLAAIDATMKSYTDRLRFRRDWIFVNLPPAWVQHLRSEEVKPVAETEHKEAPA